MAGFDAPFRVMSRKNMTKDYVLYWYLKDEKIPSHAHKTGSLVSLKDNLKFRQANPSLINGSTQGGKQPEQNSIRISANSLHCLMARSAKRSFLCRCLFKTSLPPIKNSFFETLRRIPRERYSN